ncbi:MAG: hypothetical protein V2A58_16845 [Planctomycetota bacterium]
MPLTNCRECRGEVSEEAKACPRCGVPYPARADWDGTGIDWRSQATVFGFPLVHVAYGRDKRGKHRVARGIIAIGQYGVGLVVIAQFGLGAVTVAQFGIAALLGFGQFILATATVAQFAVGILFGLGQIATGYVAIGQFATGYYAYCMEGFAKHLWSARTQDPEAVAFFQRIARFLPWHVGATPHRG